jgi:hypothetical protein
MPWWKRRAPAVFGPEITPLLPPPAEYHAICVGGVLHGSIQQKSGPHVTAFTSDGKILAEGDRTPIGRIELTTTYLWDHLTAGPRRFHVWHSSSAPVDAEGGRIAARLLVDMSASERAMVECFPEHECRLTSGE